MGFDETGTNTQDLSTESFIPTLAEDIRDEFCVKGGRFMKVELGEEDIYLEKNKEGEFFPETRFFIFPKFVIAIDDPKIEEIFAINSKDTQILEDIENFVSLDSNFKADEQGPLLGYKNINNVRCSIRRYRNNSPEDKSEVRKTLIARIYREENKDVK